MKSRLAVPVLLILVVFALSVPAANLPSKPPRIGKPVLVISSFEHSFGEVTAGTPLSYSFEVKNRGESDLEIKSVNPSCGCTTTKFDKVVMPGKAGSITLAIEKTDGYKGEVTKTATVTTNDPNHETFTLTLRATFTAK